MDNWIDSNGRKVKLDHSNIDLALSPHGGRGFFLDPLTLADSETLESLAMVQTSQDRPKSIQAVSDTNTPVPGENTQSVELGDESGPTGKLWRAVVIEAGISANNNYYSPEILEKSLPLAVNIPIRVYFFDGRSPDLPGMDWTDHMPRLVRKKVGGRIVGNTVGFFNNVRFEQIQSTRGSGKVWALVGDANITDPRMAANLLATHKAGGLNPLTSRSVYELSIEARGPHYEQYIGPRKVNVVQEITYYEEVTIVSDAAAGGRFDRLLASATSKEEFDDILAICESFNPVLLDLYACLESNGVQEPLQFMRDIERDIEAKIESLVEARLNQTVNQKQANQASQVNETTLLTLDEAESQAEKDFQTKKDMPGSCMTQESQNQTPTTNPSSVQLQEAGQASNSSMLGTTIEFPGRGFGRSSDPDFAPVKQAIFQACQYFRAGDLESGVKLLEEIIKNKEDGETNQENSSDNNPAISDLGKKALAEKTKLLKAKEKALKEATENPIKATTQDLTESPCLNLTQYPQLQTGANNMPIRHTAELNGSKAFKMDKDEGSGGGIDLSSFASKDEFRALRSELKEAVSGIGKIFRESREEATEKFQDLTALREANALNECKTYLRTSLLESGLPKSAQDLIRNNKKFKDTIFDPDTLRESISEARTLCSSILAESGPKYPSNGMQSVAADIQFGKNRLNYEKAKLDLICGYDPRKDWNNLSEADRSMYKAASQDPPSIARWMTGWYDDSVYNLGRQMGRNALYHEATSTGFTEGYLSEAVSTDLPSLLGDSQTRALMQAFKTQAPSWRNISDVVPVANFKTQRRILMGGLGKLPIVTQGDSAATYLSMGYPADEERTYGVKTRGALVVVTRQMIIDDDLQAIQAFPKKMGESAVNQLNELIFKCLQGAVGGTINGDTSYDGIAIYRAGLNYTTGALNYANLTNAIQNLSEIRQFANVDLLAAAMSDTTTGTIVATTAKFAAALTAGDDLRVDSEEFKFVSASGTTLTVTRGANGTTAATHSNSARLEQLGPPIAPDNIWIVHPNAKRTTVKELLASALQPGGGNNNVNALFDDYQEQRILPLPVHSMHLSGDKNSWWLAMNRPIEVGFLGGKEDPQLFLQDNPLVGPVFTGDQITWKVRHEYGYVLKDHRMVSAGIVP